MFWTYIIFSEVHDRFYVGQTQDVAARLSRHNAGIEKATSPYRPWTLRCSIQKGSRAEAMLLEKKLKNLNRQKLLAFIEKYCS